MRNHGCSTVPGGSQITFCWAKASTNLRWPDPWDGSVTTPALMGGEIGTTVVFSDLPGGAATGSEYVLWSNIPDPDDYEDFGADKTHFCLLARVHEPGTIPPTSDLVDMVRSRRKVVWRNITVTPNADPGPAVTVSGTSDPTTLSFQAAPGDSPGGSLFDWGVVSIDLGAGLFARWQASGALSSGITSVNGTEVVLGGPGAELRGILLGPADFYTLEARVEPFLSIENTQMRPFSLDVIHLAELSGGARRTVGGQRFVITSRIPAIPLN